MFAFIQPPGRRWLGIGAIQVRDSSNVPPVEGEPSAHQRSYLKPLATQRGLRMRVWRPGSAQAMLAGRGQARKSRYGRWRGYSPAATATRTRMEVPRRCMPPSGTVDPIRICPVAAKQPPGRQQRHHHHLRVTQRLSSQSYQPGHLTQGGVCTSCPHRSGRVRPSSS